MKAISFIVLLLTSLVCCGNNNLRITVFPNNYRSTGSQTENKKDSLTYIIITNANNTFGYDILKYGKVMIHQASIPGLAGTKGFDSNASAKKVALLVIKKIRNGEMPPTVTKEELKKLGVL